MRYLISLLIGAFSWGAMAQDKPAAATGEQTTAPDKDAPPAWKPPQPKEYTAGQKKAECQKYEGRYIGFYDQVFKVEKCKRREVEGADQISSLNLRHNVVVVDKDTIAMLDVGSPIRPAALPRKRGCNDLEGRYIILGGGDIEYVEKCQRRPFPDVETLEAHRKKHRKGDGEIIELDEAEYHALKVGKEIPSVLDSEYEKILNGKAGVDVIPLNEACKGVEGKFVTYYSKLYRIEKCRKRELDPEDFLKKPGNAGIKFVELTSEQWLSLPDGKSLIEVKKQDEETE